MSIELWFVNWCGPWLFNTSRLLNIFKTHYSLRSWCPVLQLRVSSAGAPCLISADGLISSSLFTLRHIFAQVETFSAEPEKCFASVWTSRSKSASSDCLKSCWCFMFSFWETCCEHWRHVITEQTSPKVTEQLDNMNAVSSKHNMTSQCSAFMLAWTVWANISSCCSLLTLWLKRHMSSLYIEIRRLSHCLLTDWANMS